jgi:hypothetical protein
MDMNIIVYKENYQAESLFDFEEFIFSAGLNHLASELFMYGLDDPSEMESALKRAMQACRALNIPVKRNFRPVYSYKNGEIIRDWKLSDFGKKLVLLNGDPNNPFVARMQVELIHNLRI